MDNKQENMTIQQSEQQMADILENLGITELSPETLKGAMLNGDLLSGAKSMIDTTSNLEEKPIH